MYINKAIFSTMMKIDKNFLIDKIDIFQIIYFKKNSQDYLNVNNFIKD
jgi:hypothetical protein